MRPLLLFAALAACVVPPPSAEPGPARLRRLTRAQYANAIVDLFGPSLEQPPNPEPDARFGGLLSVGATTAAISPRGVEGYEAAAFSLADQAVAPEARDRIVPCVPADVVDAACAEATLAPLGRRAFRRPLASEELAEVVALSSDAATTLGDFHAGLSFGIAAILQSPYFLYRVEIGAEGPGPRPLDGWELASRLSYFVNDRSPDDALLDLAEGGGLDTADGVADALWVLLDGRDADDGVRAFFSDWLQLARLDDLYKDPMVFPHISDTLGESLREEALRTAVDHAFVHGGDLRALATTRTTFLNRELATLYATPAPALQGWGRAERAWAEPRRGLLGQGWFLALQSHPTTTSPTLRGKFLREVMLCQQLPGAPAGVDTSIPPVTERAPTLRERVAQHLEDPGCAACHERTDPVGLGFEHFDGMGRFRSVEEGAAIDASGELDGHRFDDAAGLAEAVRTHDDFSACIVRTMLRYARGMDEGGGEDELVEWLDGEFAAQGHALRPLLELIVTSDLFRTVGDPMEDEG